MSALGILIIPLCCFMTAVLADTLISKCGRTALSFRKIKKSAVRFFPVTAAEWSVLICLYLIVRYFTVHGDDVFPSAAVTAVSALPFAAVLISSGAHGKDWNRFIRCAAYSAVLLFIAEILLFNGKSFSLVSTDEIITPDRFIKSGDFIREDDCVAVKGDSDFSIKNIPDGARALICNMEQERSDKSRRFLVQLGMKDGNFRYEYITVQEKYAMAYDEKCTLSFSPYGELHSLRLSFRQISEPVRLYSVRAVSALPFEFSMLRYAVLLGVSVFISAVVCFSLYKIKLSRRSVPHRILVYVTAAVCTAAVLPFMPKNQKLPDYDIEARKDFGYDPYAQVFDAFRKGQVYLDVDTAPELEELENVYDHSERENKGVYYKWDFAYYNGRYYCYFGAAPVLTFYFPFYFITGKLPTIAIAISFFSALAILFLCLAIYAAVRIMIPEPNLLLMLFSMPAAAGCAGVYYLLNYADMYALPLAAGMCYLMICLWSGLTACRIKRKPVRYAMLFVSGASLALCAASRPGMSVGAALLLPFFFGILANKNQKALFRANQAICFSLPLIAGISGILWYNYARFGSVLEFGASYQLTVSDISANRMRFSGIPAALYHFILQLPKPLSTFPFFEPQFFSFHNYEQYKYFEYAAGILTYPFVLAGMLMIPLSMQKRRKRTLTGAVALQRNAFIITGVLVIIFTSWQDFCLGGIIQRYVIDIMPVTVLLSAVVINKAVSGKYMYILSSVSMLATFCMGWLTAIEYPDCSLSLRCPNLYEILEDLAVFWR